MFRRQAVAFFVAGALLAALPGFAQTPRGSEILVSAPLTDVNWSAQVAVAPSGDFVVAWQTGFGLQRGKTSRVWIRLFRADGTPKGGRLRVSNSRADELLPKLAMAADGSFLVVWQGGSADDTSVFGRRFAADGRPASGRFLLSSNTEGSQSTPAVAFTPGGGFVAAWSSGPLTNPSKQSDLYARRFNAASQPLGPEFRVNTTLFNEQGSPQVAVDSQGNFLIGWLNYGGEGTFYDIYARRFAAGGAPLGDDFQVNSGDTMNISQYEFGMALRDSGESVFVWTDAGGDIGFEHGEDLQPYIGLLGQRLAADGTPAGPLFHVNAFTKGSQDNPAITLTVDGGFLVVWSSSASPGGGGAMIAARRFAADATPRDGDLRIDLAGAGFGLPAVALNAAGRGVVAWSRTARNVSEADIVARRIVQRIP
jgi:hypothetical protein